MNRLPALAIWLTLPMLAISAHSAAEASVDPLLTCTDAVVIKLNGIPRSGITPSLGEINADGSQQVNWQTQDGSSGICQVAQTGQVTRVEVEVAVSRVNQVRAVTPAISGAAAGTPVWVSTDAGSINLRSSPGGEVVGSAADGSQLIITGQTEGDWVEVTGGRWVSQYLLVTFAPTPGAAAESAQELAQDLPTSGLAVSSVQGAQVTTADGSGINVRRSPDGEILYGLSEGSTVRLTGKKQSGWVEIEGGGWVAELYLR